MRPAAESRSCRSQARWMGVCPQGDHVRRHTGWSMKPLSSKKTIGLPLRAAPFLSAASPASATASWPRRSLPVPVVRASGKSSPGRGVSFPRDRGDTPRGISWPRLRLPAGKSKGRSGSQTFAVQPRESRRVGISVSDSDGACDRDGVWLSRRPCLLSPQPAATASPKTPKRQGFPQPRQHPCLPGATLLPAVGELPVPLRFLSVSYHNIRTLTTLGSLAIQRSIMEGFP